MDPSRGSDVTDVSCRCLALRPGFPVCKQAHSMTWYRGCSGFGAMPLAKGTTEQHLLAVCLQILKSVECGQGSVAHVLSEVGPGKLLRLSCET